MQKDTSATVSTTERTVQGPAEMQRELYPRQQHTSRPEGAGCCKEQSCKLRSSYARGWVYPLELNRNLWSPSLFHPAQVNSWYSCANVDTAVQSGLSLAAPARIPGPARFPVSLQQHTLVQVHRELTKWLPKYYNH